MAYYSIDPWGEERSDMRSAVQSMVTANCALSDGKRDPFKMEDFMLKFEPDDKPKPAEETPQRQGKTWQQMLEKAKRITRSMGGKVPE